MHRREFLRGAGSVALGSAAVGSVGSGALASGAVQTTTAHPGPYRPFGSVAVENATEAVPGPDGEYAYVAAMDGFAVVDVRVHPDPRVAFEERDLLADRETGPLRQIQDVKVEGDRLVVAGPADPIGGDVLQGFLLYDVSDPASPERLAFFETNYPIHNCDIHNGLVYLTGNQRTRNDLVVVDASDDDPTEVGRWSLADRDDRWTEVPSGIWQLHDVWLRDDRAYLAHWDAGTLILDVSDPASPELVSQVGGRSLDDLAEIPSENSRDEVLALPGNDHYAMTNEDGSLLARNKEAWAVDGEGGPGGVELWDVSDETSPEHLSTIDPPPSPDPSQGGTWTTSHNLDLVNDRLFTSWYQGGVKIHDVSDPANPSEMAWWRMPGETAFWTAKRVNSQFFLASNIGDYLGGVEGEAGLYTFPIEEDVQKSPPSLTTEGGGNATGTGGDGTGTGREATTDTPTTTERAAFGADTTAADSDAGGNAPGFGVVTGVAALLGAGAWKAFRD